MISFRQFLTERSTRREQLSWTSSPRIGWWRDADPLRVYHGTDAQHLDSIAREGLNRRDPKTNLISVALEPFTARAFAVMGGEARFLGAGARAKVVPQDRRIVVVFDLPRAFVEAHEDENLGGNDSEHKKRLRERSLYDDWTDSDQQYYQLCELRLSAEIPPRYLVGWMRK